MSRVSAVGEILIDFISADTGCSIENTNSFYKKAGGAPANVCAAVSKLGGSSQFIGKVGSDSFGAYLKNVLISHHVDISQVFSDPLRKTTLAFVSLKEDGERDFIFNRGADEFLHFNELDSESILTSKIGHFGSATALLGGSLKETYMQLLKEFKKHKILISFDPNFRSDLWHEKISVFIKEVEHCLPFADLVKMSESEIEIITGESNLEKSCAQILDYGPKCVIVTRGKKGSYLALNDNSAEIHSVKVSPVVDTTGAGDAFVGALLYKLSLEADQKDAMNDFEKMSAFVLFANKAGALTCTKKGAIEALPELKDIVLLD